jgi:pyridoxamine 5'-phosphate oxidase
MNDWPEPIARFAAWWQELHQQVRDESADAVVLSSVGRDGQPSSRVVLLRAFDARGFVFYTNLQSRKGEELLARPAAALTFFWPQLERQVRVEGQAARVSDEEADAYFASRPRESQIGAWASDQSRPLASRDALLGRVADVRARFGDGSVPRPPHWSGLRVVPDAIELWRAGEFRLHTRERWTRQGATWSSTLLFP